MEEGVGTEELTGREGSGVVTEVGAEVEEGR